MGEVSRIEPVVAPVRRATFSEQATVNLRHTIISGSIAPGTPLTEAALAQEFAISRGPLREALAQLSAEGLIVSVPYKGTRVVSLSKRDVGEIFSLRTALETLAFRELWPRRTEAFADNIRARHERLLATLELGDHVASSAAEVAFHSLVYEACGHQLLLESWQRLSGRLQLYLAVHQRAHGRTGPVRDAHERYAQLAIGTKLGPMLKEVEAHMQRGVRQLEAYLEASGAG